MGFVNFMMACNNPENGTHQGWAEAFQFDMPSDFGDPVMELEGTPITVRLEGDQLRISRRKFHIQNYGEWVGNWCWDCAVMDIETALELAAYLQSMKKFDCTSGYAEAFDAWADGKPITRAMFED